MSFRPTTLERAYALAESGEFRTVGEVKQRLSAEGYDRIADQLYGATITSALRKLCTQHYRAPEGEPEGTSGSGPDADPDLVPA